MKRAWTCLLIVAALIGTLMRAITCDELLLPELTFNINGRNLKWPCQSVRDRFQFDGRYVPSNTIATRVQMYKDQAILVLPRFKCGTPVTLAVISLKTHSRKPQILPFPNWTSQELDDCAALQNVVDIALDVQGIIWALDIGIINTLKQPMQLCPPKVLGIDVETGKVIKTIDLSPLILSNSRLQFLVVDWGNDGEVYLYLSDAATRTIIVYNVTRDVGYRLKLPMMVISQDCRCRDVLYLVLVRNKFGDSILYFSYLNSGVLFSTTAENLKSFNYNSCIVYVGGVQGKMVLLGTDNGDVIFFRFKGESDVYMWSTELAFRPENFLLVQKGNDCRLPSQVVPGYKWLMWVIESNFHDYVADVVGHNGASMILHPLARSCAYPVLGLLN